MTININNIINNESRPNDFSSVATVDPNTITADPNPIYEYSTASALTNHTHSEYISLSTFYEFRDEMYAKINSLEKKCDELTQMVLCLQAEKTNRKRKKDEEVNINEFLL